MIKSDAADCTSSVTSDAGKREHGVEVTRIFPVMFIDDDLSGALHVANAGVIAESFPKFMDFLRTDFGERSDVRQR